ANARERVLAERVAHLQRALTNRNVVCLRSREVLQRSAIGLRLERADIHLHAAAQLEADLVATLRKYFGNSGKSHNAVEQGIEALVGTAWAGDQDVEISDSVASTTQRAGRCDLVDP